MNSQNFLNEFTRMMQQLETYWKEIGLDNLSTNRKIDISTSDSEMIANLAIYSYTTVPNILKEPSITIYLRNTTQYMTQ
ncbi:10879_t:CDS:2 [Ambispora leptoticha]|uniref:10879_t:CDS:1 n=1 Tax=Ambispora leptoticha TaxID=144679 RepID=A0A9N9FLU0_9GLOM|nr:10879_t:CDS:2 [Ambispora leptoticha]